MVAEGPEILKNKDYLKLVEHPVPFIFSASLGVVVTISAMGVIKFMSSLTFKVLGQARNMGIILLSIFLFHNVVTLLQFLGYIVQIGGFQLYQVRYPDSPSSLASKYSTFLTCVQPIFFTNFALGCGVYGITDS